MKKLFLFLSIVFISIQSQAQNSTLWYKIQEIREQYFPETINEVLHSTTGGFGTDPHKSYSSKYFKSPVVIIDNKYVSYPGSINAEQEALAKINTYQLSQIAGINYITKAEMPNSPFFRSDDTANGVIAIYTHEYTAANPWVRDFFKISFENGQIGDRNKKEKK
jgi:hypothetical protein